MTAIERIEKAARAARIDVRPAALARELILTAPTSRLWVRYDRIGRLLGAQVDNKGRCSIWPAADVESRIVSWIGNHTQAAAPDPFEVMESSNEAADAFAQGGASGLAQLDERRRDNGFWPVVVQVEPDVFEVRQHGEAISFLGAEAEALRDQLVELLGPAPSDVR